MAEQGGIKWPRKRPRSGIGGLESLYRSVTDGRVLDAKSLYIRGVLAHENGRFDEAAEYLAKAICLTPADLPGQIKFGQVCEQAQWLRQASFAFLRALYLQPNDPETWFRLGRTYAGQNLAGHAEACFRQAIALDPGHSNARTALAALVA